ncbi:hypothetical protein PHYBLDRAFT_97609, partial [Phycomyces blakesleeanus NRRL 1555(-)]
VPHVKASFFTYMLVMCVCVGGFLFGYDTGVISGALQPLQEKFGLSTVQKELVVGATTLGAIFGGFFAGLLSDKMGRKILVIISSVIFIAGALLLALAPSYGVLLLGRLVVGVAVGVASMIVPVYVSELAPKHIRGRLTTLNTLVITFGQVIAYVMNIAFASVDNGWRYMFGIAGIPALFQFIIMPFLPESPRRLVITNKLEQAKSTLRKIYGPEVTEAFIENQVRLMLDDVNSSSSSSFKDLIHRDTLRPLIIACLLQAAQQLSGFNAAMYYAATILQMAGFRSNQNSTSVAIIVSVTNMVFTAVAVSVIDWAGRRRMVVITMLMMIAGLISLGATFAAQQGFIPKQDSCSGYVTHCARNDKAITGILLTSLIVYVASYALGLGYAPWLIQSEMFSNSVRGKANGVSTAVNWICNLIISTTFLSMTDTLTSAGTFWFYAGISFILWIGIYFLLPEVNTINITKI